MIQFEKSEAIRDIAYQMQNLLNEARDIAESVDGIFMGNKDAYIFEQIKEHIENKNPFNQSLMSLAQEIENLEVMEEEEDEEEG